MKIEFKLYMQQKMIELDVLQISGIYDLPIYSYDICFVRLKSGTNYLVEENTHEASDRLEKLIKELEYNDKLDGIVHED